jgi:holliday junction DNA helicase RuvB
VCANLRVFIAAARGRDEPLDHVLLHGPPGLGKTTLAQIVAHELGSGFARRPGRCWRDPATSPPFSPTCSRRTCCSSTRSTGCRRRSRDPLSGDGGLQARPGDRRGAGGAHRAHRRPPFTLVGATTRAGLITRPLRERFGIPLRLEFYEPADLARIVRRGARILAFEVTDDGAEEIARRSRGTPRIAVRLLRRVRDFATVDGHPVVDAAIAAPALDRLDIDDRGLDAMDRRYLRCIADHYGGGPVGVETLAAAISEQRDTIEEVIEPYLMQQGFLMRTPRGRVLAAAALRHLGLPVIGLPGIELPDQLELLDDDANP